MKDNLLLMEFDLHPLESDFDQRVKLKLLPVQVIYDGATVDHFIEMFLPPAPMRFQKMSTSVAWTLETLRTQTRAGLQHAISQRKLMDLDILLYSPLVRIPENGVMKNAGKVLVVDLGSLHLTNDMKHHIPDIQVCLVLNTVKLIVTLLFLQEATMKELEEAFYDDFNVSISDVKLLLMKGMYYYN